MVCICLGLHGVCARTVPLRGGQGREPGRREGGGMKLEGEDTTCIDYICTAHATYWQARARTMSRRPPPISDSASISDSALRACLVACV